MAFIQMNLLSKSLMRTVPVNVILPADKMVFPGMPVREDKPYKTLYLLHGVFGNYTDWVNGTRIQRFAEENDLVVVMPSGDNAFYVDQPKGNNYYGEFIGKELVELTRKMFPLSHRREDTFIGGLSMGGYGAIRNGLKYSDTFGYVVALSSALLTESLPDRTNEAPFFLETRDYAESCFGNLDEVLTSDKNPKYLVEQLIKEGKELPAFFMACGDQDSLLGVNQDFADFLKENQAEITFEVGPGDHEWDFWDTYIKKGIEWLPVETAGLGINSGNVGI
ncbi:alpha/beta hydrolase [Anaerobium acetethylicum]|uniref:S-formylglutathione hydrolase FrmB n=1 Tax=Anaerobium acetethylicum TaxID=1619234 RepID=A0A1D3TWQ7_9FIRM|nr:alpha/beta hydrolase family protein [Anaerobium acetethylicum]SCP98687.1 S-formylglutathione hydrolase FrmB [Anaerobium acetethylicum]